VTPADHIDRPPLRLTVENGLVAGAVGVTALNTVTYLDMAIRARPPSGTPEEAVREAVRKVGAEIPGDREKKDNRFQGLGPIAGIATGLAAGATTAVIRRWRSNLNLPLTAAVAGAIAMAAADGPIAALGVTDPKQWSAGAWLADVIPHLGYGVATAAVLCLTE
jgi:hypothetical protein